MQNDPIDWLTDAIMLSSIGIWIILGIGGFFLFHLWNNVASKKKWFPRYLILEGALATFICTATAVLHFRSLWSLCVLVFLVPGVALIVYLGMKFTKFCDQCGAVIYDGNWFSPAKFCSACGADLRAKPNSDVGVPQ